MSTRVVVTDCSFPDVAQEREAAESAGASFEIFQAKSEDDVVEVVGGADVIVVQFAPFGSHAISAVNPGATIIRYGVGYDNIDLKAARDAGVTVGYVPDYCTNEVADHTVAMALAMLRKLPQLDTSVRNNRWAAIECTRPVRPLSELTFGFLGLGQIGKAVLSRIRPFGFSSIVTDPGLTDEEAQRLGVCRVDEDKLLQESDLLTLHAPANAKTAGFLNSERLARMKRNAVVVNSARGQLVVDTDLAEACQLGIIGGAALDVFQHEPLPSDSPLRRAPNVMLSPHVAWYSEAAIQRLQGLVAEDITRILKGEGPRKPVEGWVYHEAAA